MRYRLWYTTVYVRDFSRAVDFYADTLGLPLLRREDDFGYAAFDTGFAQFSLTRVDDSMDNVDELTGRHTGLGLAVDDLAATHKELAAKGVEFPMPPTKQPWGGTIALFADPEGNISFLDEYREGAR
jgi:predicted enzyme related to lactoylglutathione lyase